MKASFFAGTVILVILGGAVPMMNGEPLNRQPTICETQGLDCYGYGIGLAAGAAHPGSTNCPSITANKMGTDWLINMKVSAISTSMCYRNKIFTNLPLSVYFIQQFLFLDILNQYFGTLI